MSLVEPLTEAIRADDTRRVRDLVVSAPEKERRAAAKAVEGLLFVGDYSRRDAARLAFVGTATARRLSSWAWATGAAGGEEVVYGVVAARGRSFVETLARAMAREEATPFWRLIRRAVREGLIERPEDEGYTRGLVSHVGEREIRSVDRVYRGLLVDEESPRGRGLEDLRGRLRARAQLGGRLRARPARRHAPRGELLDVRAEAALGGRPARPPTPPRCFARCAHARLPRGVRRLVRRPPRRA